MQLHINHKYRSVLLVLLLLAIMSTSAQTLDWNRCFGGSYMDMPRSIIECKDGGYMLIGHSNSDDGDVLCEGFSGYDIWVTKLNKEGIIEWENKYGGHSLRSGFATSAAEFGAEERNIMAMTGHKTTQMVRRYIQEANLFKNNALNKIKI